MKISYYPGCTLRTQAKDLDKYARASAAALGVEMEEIEKWLPIVAASQSVKGKPDERDFLISWADVVDYE